jgi:hypothetical protein
LDFEGINYGYRLVDKNTGEVLKFGETTNPANQYTQAYLNENNTRMEIMNSGSKLDVHDW